MNVFGQKRRFDKIRHRRSDLILITSFLGTTILGRTTKKQTIHVARIMALQLGTAFGTRTGSGRPSTGNEIFSTDYNSRLAPEFNVLVEFTCTIKRILKLSKLFDLGVIKSNWIPRRVALRELR